MFCRECRYSDYLTSECRRRAPKVTVISKGAGRQISTKWPQTKPTDWCGDFAPMGGALPKRDE